MITDLTIINLFFSKKGNRTTRYQKIIDNNLEIKSYLDSRYSDCIDYNEILWRITIKSWFGKGIAKERKEMLKNEI